MDLAYIKAKAEEAIANNSKNPFSKALGLKPCIQVYKASAMQGLPEYIKCEYVGQYKGLYVYNLDAVDVLEWIKVQEMGRRLLQYGLELPPPSDTSS